MSRIEFLGCPIDNLTMSEAIAAIEEFIRDGTPHLVVALNAPKLWRMERDTRLDHIIRTADLILPEKVVVMGSRFVGTPLRAYIGNDRLTQALLHVASERGYRLFFLGTFPHILDRLIENLKRDFPALNVVGWHHGFFTEREAKEVGKQIRLLSPDILFVGMGTPRQEYWMDTYGRRLNVPVIIGVGGTLDMLAGVKRTPPNLIRSVGMEWLYRLVEDPLGKWKRYTVSIPWFLWKIFMARLSFSKRNPVKTSRGPDRELDHE